MILKQKEYQPSTRLELKKNDSTWISQDSTFANIPDPLYFSHAKPTRESFYQNGEGLVALAQLFHHSVSQTTINHLYISILVTTSQLYVCSAGNRLLCAK